jgi:ferredoxin
VDGAKLDGAKKKSVTEYKLDFTKCSLCGSCVEACRDGAIRFSRDYNLAGLNKEEFIMDLFAKLQAEAQAAGVQPAQKETIPHAASESISGTHRAPLQGEESQPVAAVYDRRTNPAEDPGSAGAAPRQPISDAHRAPLQGKEPVKKDAQ